jgi:hypothetical protein
MTFQAYLDNIQARTGVSPAEFVVRARALGYLEPDVKATVIVNWLKADYGLGRGHAMAIVAVIKRARERER